MKPEMRERILAYNRTLAKDRETAADFMRLLDALPPGPVKQLMKDKVCGGILRKYGLSE